MATGMKRFTISVTDEMGVQLDGIKQARYYNTTKNKMIQDLIMIGITEMKKEIEKDNTKLST